MVFLTWRMPYNENQFRELVARVGEFYITHKKMRKAQDKIEAALRNGSAQDPSEQRTYLQAVRQYFTEFDREARKQLRSVDQRLENVNQVHFNLTAERGVAVRRIEATQNVLRELSALNDPQK